jgi:hypothetical protein
LQVRAQSVEQSALITRGAFVVAGDRAQLRTQLPVGDERAQPGVAVQRKQAADPGVLGVVFLARRTTTTSDEIGIDWKHAESRVEQRFDQEPMSCLQHHPNLGGVGLRSQTAPDQPLYSGRAVLDPELVSHPFRHRSQSDVMKLFRPVDTNSQHPCSFLRRHRARRTGKARRRADGPVLTGRHPPGRRAFAGARQGRCLTAVLAGQVS